LQASINVLRHHDIDYADAASSQDLKKGDFTDATVGLTYITDSDGIDKVNMATNAKYKVQVINPDNSLPYTFQTSGTWNSTEAINAGRTLCVPTCAAAARTEITFTNRPSGNVTFPLTANPELGQISVNHVAGGAAVPAGVELNIIFQLTSPRFATKTIKAVTGATAAGAPINIAFFFSSSTIAIVPTYSLLRKKIQVRSTTTPCVTDAPGCPPMTILPVSTTATVYVNVEEIDPFRLIIRSTGYGPGGSKKTLEGIIQKNFFDDVSSTSAIAMLGPSA